MYTWSKNYKHETGFEPATLALARRYSTTEPLAHLLFAAFSLFSLRTHTLKTTYCTISSLSVPYFYPPDCTFLRFHSLVKPSTD